MSRKVYLKNYRLREEGGSDAPPPPVGETGPATTFKATDIRSGAPVLLTLIPVGAIPDAQRAKFEANARSIVQFDHVHVARTVDFEQEDDEYAFVSEYPRGETTEQWVAQYGRMPPEAVLRIAIQVVSAIGAAAFQQIIHGGIRPSNIVITPGQVAEGGWPSIKLVNLAIAGLGIAGADFANFASPEQLGDGEPDFRSEIYSLGATMCFLLTGAFYSAEPRSLQTRRFARSLRKLIEPMLRQDPNERPQDPVKILESLRTGLEAVERRQDLARRLGIPFLAVRTRSTAVKPPKPSPKPIFAPMGGEISPVNDPVEPSIPVGRRWSPAFGIVAALLLGLGIIGAAVIPVRHMFFAHENSDKSGEIGVPIGVSQPASVWEGKPLVMNKDQIPTGTDSQGSAARAATPRSTPIANEQAAAADSSSQSASPAVAQADRSEPPSPAAGPQSVWEKAGNRPLSEGIVSKDGIGSANNAEMPNQDKRAESAGESQPDSGSRISSSANDRSEDEAAGLPKRTGDSENAHARSKPTNPATARKTGRPMTGRGSVARIASDGSVILRLPNGEIAVLPPPRDEYPVRRYHRPRRVIPDPPPGYPYLPPN